MADLEYTGLDETIKALEGANLYTEDTQQEMLYAGGEEIARCMSDEMTRSGFRLAEISKHVACRHKVSRDKYGYRFVTVTVTGTDRKGVSNAVIAFVLNYGRAAKFGAIAGGHFWNRGWQKGELAANTAVEKLAEKKLSEKGLI